MPLIVGSLLAWLILLIISSISVARKSSTRTPISSPYLILRLTYFVITGLSESRMMRSLGLFLRDLTWWAWRSLMKPASSLPFNDFIESPRVLVRASNQTHRRLRLRFRYGL